jgi:hypothetical protein
MWLHVYCNKWKTCRCTNQINHHPECNNFPLYYPDVYLQLNMFRTFSRPSSGAKWLQWQPLVLPEAATPETCLVVNKRQDNKLENCCIWLVIYLNCTMMHGLTNLKPCMSLYISFLLCQVRTDQSVQCNAQLQTQTHWHFVKFITKFIITVNIRLNCS